MHVYTCDFVCTRLSSCSCECQKQDSIYVSIPMLCKFTKKKKKKKNHIQPEGFRVYKTFGAKVSGHIFKTYINLQGSANTGHLRYLQEKKK